MESIRKRDELNLINEKSTINYNSPAASSGSSRIILVGTAHVSDRSIAEVNAVIEKEKPDIVAVELCNGRYQSLNTDFRMPFNRHNSL
jgi:pheromone shutdown protein TraB